MSSAPFVSPGFANPNEKPFTKDNGCVVTRTFHPNLDRYAFDFKRCQASDGWEQYDTEQDAWYFGVWVRLETREVVTFAEGDIEHVQAPTEEAFRAELAKMAKFYGDTPPAFRVITAEGVAEVVAARPGEEGPKASELLAEVLST